MARLEDLTAGTLVKGIMPDGLVKVIQAKWHGSNVIERTYKDSAGNPRCELLYRDREPTLEIASAGSPWSFDADGASAENRGDDIESKVPATGRLLFIEVKGRASGSVTVTITRNETLKGLNKPDDYILAWLRSMAR
jgi:hypothetical protein